MTRFTVPDGVTSISTCGQEFRVTDGNIDLGDTSSDVVDGLVAAGCEVVDEAEPDLRTDKQKVRDQLTEAGIDHDARASVASLQKLLPT